MTFLASGQIIDNSLQGSINEKLSFFQFRIKNNSADINKQFDNKVITIVTYCTYQVVIRNHKHSLGLLTFQYSSNSPNLN